MNKNKILRILYPEVCPVCGEILTEENRYEENPYICRFCYKKAGFITGPCCLKCSKPLEDETQVLCRDCRERERYFDLGFALLSHDEGAKKVIYGLKFDHKLDNAAFPSLEIALRYGQRLLDLETEVLIPVPLHKSRQRERGYNQARILSEKISEFIEGLYGKSLSTDGEYLLRREKTKYQRDLDPREREENVKNAFAVNLRTEKNYRRVCLVDDIYTTGSTMNSCARTLKNAGCEKVFFLAVSTVG